MEVTNMKAELSEAQISLWTRVFVGIFFCTLIYAMSSNHITLTKKIKELESRLDEQEISNREVIDYLNGTLPKSKSKTENKKTFLQKETECLAKNIYFEAAHEPYQGKLAVATVTMNRVNSKLFPKTVCGVVLQKNGRTCQFSWTCDGKSDVIRNRKEYNSSLKIAKEVLINKKRSGIIGRNVYNYHANYIMPTWANNMEMVAEIGNHVFYKFQKRNSSL